MSRTLLLSLLFLLIIIGSSVAPTDDEYMEWAAQQQAQKLSLQKCLAERGEGAAPVFDDAGMVVDCLPRWKS
jgi:hypothetical protein